MFVLTQARFHCRDHQIFVLQGYSQGGRITREDIRARTGGKDLEVSVSFREGLAVRQKYFARGIGYEDIDREYDIWITLPDSFAAAAADGDSAGARSGAQVSLSAVCAGLPGCGEVLDVVQTEDGKEHRIYRSSLAALRKMSRMLDGYLETYHDEDGMIRIGGWAVGAGPCSLRVYAGGKKDWKKIPVTVTRHFRQDLLDQYPEAESTNEKALYYGFEVSFSRPEEKKVLLVAGSKGCRIAWTVRLDKPEGALRIKGQSLFTKAAAYFRRNGLKRTLIRSKEKLSEKLTGRGEDYMSWRKRHLPSQEELGEQRLASFLYEPLISVAVPLYRTDEKMLCALIESLKAQTYANWQLCLSDGSGSAYSLREILERESKKDTRIQYICSDIPLGISENTNMALSIAKGEFIAFMDHDDLLPANALYECVKIINEDPAADLIYTDEDKVSADGKRFFEPHFKTDYNPDLLCSMNYFCHLVVISSELVDRILRSEGSDGSSGEAGAGSYEGAESYGRAPEGSFRTVLRPEFDGAQDYDLVLRASEKAGRIVHIPKVLYHWRTHSGSTSENPESKRYAFEAGKRAVQAHYDRCGIRAVVSEGPYPGLYRTDYLIPDPAPMVSIIIPNKDHMDDLQKCVQSILKTDYPDYEILIVENNSTSEEIFAYYEQLQAADSRIRVLTWEKPFNYSAINNFGAAHARGEYLLLLNNDTQMLHPDCISRLVGPALRREVGGVGARLYYPDHTIQHAGVIIGYGGIAGHAFQNMPDSANGYFSRILCQSDLSAVTAACLLVPRTVWIQMGGLDESFEVAFNDIDLCLRIRESGRLIVYEPYAELIHSESKSRGYEDTPGKISRFNQEAGRFMKKWPKILKEGDPYYNPNLSLDSNDFRLKS